MIQNTITCYTPKGLASSHDVGHQVCSNTVFLLAQDRFYGELTQRPVAYANDDDDTTQCPEKSRLLYITLSISLSLSLLIFGKNHRDTSFD